MRDEKGRFIAQPKTQKNCLTCNKIFVPYNSEVRRGKGKYCSLKCRPIWNKGTPNTWFNPKGLILGRGWNKDKTHKTDKRIARAWLGKKRVNMTGEKNWNWKGGITADYRRIRKSQDYILWRTAVLIRDDYTCQECFTRGGKLQVDHIKPFALYPELRLAIDNGRTLCIDCHKQTDTWGGRVWLHRE